jgi:hypothetical protein
MYLQYTVEPKRLYVLTTCTLEIDWIDFKYIISKIIIDIHELILYLYDGTEMLSRL